MWFNHLINQNGMFLLDKTLKPKKDFDKYLEKIKELKDMYSQI